MNNNKKDIIPISPVTFISGEPSTDQSINALFTSAYDAKIVADLGHSLMIDEVKKTISDPEDDVFYNWAKDVYYQDRQGLSDAIMSYAVTNITDLTYSTLLRFLGKFNENDHNMIGRYLVNDVVNFDIQSEVTNAMASSGFCTNREYTPDQIYIINQMAMDTVYAMLYTKVFERYIINHINHALQIGAFEALYNVFYYANFEEDPKSYPDVQTMYAFCSSMFREMFEPFAQDFRCALMLVAKTISAMVTESPRYALHAADLQYRTMNAIEECDQLCGLISVPNLIGESDEGK